MTPDATTEITFTEDPVRAEDRNFITQPLSSITFDGCNTCNGGYEVSDTGEISIEPGLCTSVSCEPPPALESLYVTMLRAAIEFELHGDALEILASDPTNGGTVQLCFVSN